MDFISLEHDANYSCTLEERPKKKVRIAENKVIPAIRKILAEESFSTRQIMYDPPPIILNKLHILS